MFLGQAWLQLLRMYTVRAMCREIFLLAMKPWCRLLWHTRKPTLPKFHALQDLHKESFTKVAHWVFKCPFGLMGLKLRIHPVPLLHIKTLAYKDSSCQNQNLLWQHYHKDLNRNPQSCDLRKGPVTCSAAIGWSILFYFFVSAAFIMFGVCQMSNLLCAITEFFI